ncbi:hypothetical protein [Flavilitoribacter nigricans]|uniref:Lipoprotein n=1 Tax=Flavilitoribacter nigricans (strain ATCC 23147 / DSM 23189 / NBRC 102662 / NCIMB 1420 / SS-2) TaxID=1122177 RepID=A0A2D0NIF8_FLAN2|nr:hypothetical protein [Flavilitoribacter nigricans]PHN08156.1 hypothetical protein CRP01_02210 [Flavilitoribacter nigricans DSM 23189 = NBRC 102662]
MNARYLYYLPFLLFGACLPEASIPDVCAVDFSGAYAYRPEFKVTFPPEVGADLGPCTRAFPDNVQGYFLAFSDEICPVEQNFLKLLEMDPALSDPPGWQLDREQLEMSALQYIGMLIEDRRYVYLNGFTFYSEEDLQNNFLNWRDRFVQPCDAGAWGALFDLEIETFSDLAFENR